MSTKKRIVPSKAMLECRKRFLINLKSINPLRPDDPQSIKLTEGNSKTGKTGKCYKNILVWDLPAVVTCPGASNWCLEHCYNADSRVDVFPLKKWSENWWTVINESETLFNNISNQLLRIEKPCAVRVHSSGDYYSPEYIDFFSRLAKEHHDIRFWSYTRSWTRPNLLPNLERLWSQDNFQLFASHDDSMALDTPNRWRKAVVCYDTASAKKYVDNHPNSKICPEQVTKFVNCASCGLCIRKTNKNIVFFFH